MQEPVCYFSLYYFSCQLFAAITVTGHESPIIVGLSGSINCTTILNASKLEWILVGIGTGDPIEETDKGQSLVLSLSPEATELNGAKLTCKVTTIHHQVFEETITITIKGETI